MTIYSKMNGNKLMTLLLHSDKALLIYLKQKFGYLTMTTINVSVVLLTKRRFR